MAEQASVRMSEADTLAARLTKKMEAIGSNPFALSKAAGIGESYVRDILRGKVKEPSGAKLMALAGVLGCSVEDLIVEEGNSAPRATSPMALKIAGRLRELGLTANGASEMAGLHRDAIRMILTGRSKSPGSETLVAIARVLECTVDDLVGSDAPNTIPAGISDALTIRQSESGMWFATREGDRPIFVGAKTLEDLCVMLPEAIRRAG